MDKHKQDRNKNKPEHTKSPGDVNKDKDAKNPQRKSKADRA